MIPAHLRRTAWFVFGAALFVRLAFLSFSPQPRVQFDARLYVAAGLAAPYVVAHPSLWNAPQLRDSIDFLALYDDIIADEQVFWYPYGVTSFTDAVDAIFYGGPVLPAILGPVFYLMPRFDIWCVRILFAIIDSLTAVLLWLLFRRLISKWGAAVAAGLWILYFPAIIKTGELITETPSTFLAVLTIYALVETHHKRTRWRLLGCGVLCALLALAKASMAILLVPIVIAWFLARRAQWRQAIGEAGLVVCGWVLLMAPWFLVVYLRFGSIGFRDPSYGTANFRQANTLVTEGYLADTAPSDFWTYPVWREMKNNPSAYVALYVQKFRRLWWHACDDYKRATGFWQDIIQWGHRLVVLFALLGILVWLTRAGPPAMFPVVVILYLMGLHTIMHVVSRYNLLAMPFVCGAATVGGIWLYGEGKVAAKRWLMSAGLIVVAAVLVGVLRPTAWLMLPGMKTSIAVWLYWLAATVIILAVVWFVVVRGRELSRSLPIAFVAGAVVLAATYGWIVPREGHAEWCARIDRPGVELMRTIEIPEGAVPDSISDALIAIDARLAPHSAFDIRMTLDNSMASFPESQLLTEESVFPKANYAVVAKERGDQQPEIRRWIKQSVNLGLLDSLLQDRQVTIRMAIDTRRAHEGALLVYGDLPFEDPRQRPMPGINFTSIERYFEGGDPRIWETLPFGDAASQCILTRDSKRSSQDLSPQFGCQSGEYRILLALLLPDGRIVYY